MQDMNFKIKNNNLKIINMLDKARHFVDKSFKLKDVNKNTEHFERTVFWVKKLKPDADESILIAVYSHDIGRAFSVEDRGFWENKELNDADYLEQHQKASAKILCEFLKKEGYDKSEIKRVKYMVRHHEVGGDFESNLIKDADSISYFEVNAPRHVKKFGKMFGKRKTKVKFDFMFNRISCDEAKKIAEPMYKKNIKMLERETRWFPAVHQDAGNHIALTA